MKYFRRGIVTNNFLTPSDYRSEIAEGELFYEASDNALSLYTARDGFYILYFYAAPDCDLPKLPSETTVCEVSGKSEDIAKNHGFTKLFDRIKLEASFLPSSSDGTTAACADDAESVYSLLNECFDPTSAYLPTLTQLRAEAEEGLLKLYRRGEEILGVLRYGISGKCALIKHLCVAKNASGQGIAKRLCLSLMSEHEKCSVWTSAENMPAVSLYKKLGFSETGKSSTVYITKNINNRKEN